MSGAAWAFSWKDVSSAHYAFADHCFCTECTNNKPSTISPLEPEVFDPPCETTIIQPPSSNVDGEKSKPASTTPSPRPTETTNPPEQTQPTNTALGCNNCTLETVPTVLVTLQDFSIARRRENVGDSVTTDDAEHMIHYVGLSPEDFFMPFSLFLRGLADVCQRKHFPKPKSTPETRLFSWKSGGELHQLFFQTASNPRFGLTLDELYKALKLIDPRATIADSLSFFSRLSIPDNIPMNFAQFLQGVSAMPFLSLDFLGHSYLFFRHTINKFSLHEPSFPLHPVLPSRKGNIHSRSLSSSLPAKSRSPPLHKQTESATLFLPPHEGRRPPSAPSPRDIPTLTMLQPVPTQLCALPRTPPAIPTESPYNHTMPFLRKASVVPPIRQQSRAHTSLYSAHYNQQAPQIEKNFAGLNADLATSTAPFRAFRNTHIKQVTELNKGVFRV